jgi:pyruvate,orthophosphate dikinase
MAATGLPVPQAFVLGTGFCEDGTDVNQVLAAQLRLLERATSLTYGGSRRPLLLSVRSGAPVSMPGMMHTILNVGLNETALRGLLRMAGNPRLTWDSYRRLIHSFAEVVNECDAGPFETLLAEHLETARVARAQELDARALSTLVREYLALYRKLVGHNFPQDPMEQLRAAVQGVFRSWNSARAQTYPRVNGLADTVGTAVTVQRMVFGNAGGTSGSGVAFTRDPATGENRVYVDFMFNAQGEDVVSGKHAVVDAPQLASILPVIEQQIGGIAHALESEFRDMQEFEFTVQDESLYLLQTRTGNRTAPAQLKIACDLAREGLITSAEAVARTATLDLNALRRDRVAVSQSEALARGTAAGCGVAIGSLVLDVERAQPMARQEPVILVRRDATTADIAGLAAAQGVLTATGGRTSHACVVARDLNKVAIVGCHDLAIDSAARTCRIAGTLLGEGEVICLDGNTGCVYRGRPALLQERPDADIADMERWRRNGSRPAHKAKARAI